MQKAQTNSVNATTQNTEAQTALTQVNTALANIQKGIQGDIADKGYIQKQLEAQIDNINQQTIAIENSNWTFNKTKDAVIQNIQQITKNSVLTGISIKAGINLTNEQIEQMSQNISNMKTNQQETIQKIQLMLSQHWKHGNIYCGTYVNEQTINYIVKYVFKKDATHKNYTPKILTSKGIGAYLS